MKALVLTDIEGMAGVVSFESQAYPDGKDYEKAKSLLTAEVNAAVEAMVSQGIEDILILDGHGPGAVQYKELHSAARLVHGRPFVPNWIDHESYGLVEFCAVIGQHAMVGTADGNLNHTQNSREIESIKLNGKPIGEFAQFAYCQGLKGRPVIFVSGDRAACREDAALIPGIVTAKVKIRLGRNCAISLSQAQAHKLIFEKLSQAVQHFQKNPPVRLSLEGPCEIEIQYFHSDRADAAKASGGIRIGPATIRFESDHLRDILYRN